MMTRGVLLYWSFVIGAFLVTAFSPARVASDSNSGGLDVNMGVLNLSVLVVSNSIDGNLTRHWINESVKYLNDVNILLVWTTPSGYTNCSSGYYKCLYLGGHMALGNMSNITEPMLDNADESYIMQRPSLINVGDGRRFVLAGRGRNDTAEASRLYADDVLP